MDNFIKDIKKDNIIMENKINDFLCKRKKEENHGY